MVTALTAAMVPAMVLAAGKTVSAAEDEEYTYTVKLFAGNQGELKETGISVSRADAPNPEGVTVKYGKNQITVKGLKYEDTVYINYQDAASVTDEHYYVKGVRRSGRDNSEATESVFSVGSDRDYVIAYGIKGDMVAYTVNYVDEDGNELLKSDTYYGNPGERQYVSARYVDGYQPQAYNLVKTLVQNEAENVFSFIYTPAPEERTPEQPSAGETPGTAAPGTTGTGTDAGTAANTAGQEGNNNQEDGQTDDDQTGGNQTALPDDQTPEALQDLDDEETPLGQQVLEADRPGTVVSYLPIYIGIGAAAIGALLVMALYLRKKRKVYDGKQ